MPVRAHRGAIEVTAGIADARRRTRRGNRAIAVVAAVALAIVVAVRIEQRLLAAEQQHDEREGSQNHTSPPTKAGNVTPWPLVAKLAYDSR